MGVERTHRWQHQHQAAVMLYTVSYWLLLQRSVTYGTPAHLVL